MGIEKMIPAVTLSNATGHRMNSVADNLNMLKHVEEGCAGQRVTYSEHVFNMFPLIALSNATGHRMNSASDSLNMLKHVEEGRTGQRVTYSEHVFNMFPISDTDFNRWLA